MVEGYINKKIWSARNFVKNKYLKDFIDYYIVGGMTKDEQTKYLPQVGKDPLLLCRGNMAIDFLSTVAISLGGPVFDFVAGSISEYELQIGLYTGLTTTSWSFLVNGSRFIYSAITKKPVESLSPLALFANSTTYLNKLKSKMETLDFVVGANHSEMRDLNKFVFQEKPKSIDLIIEKHYEKEVVNY